MLSDNILTLRKKQNLTQEELANKMGVSFHAISKWENRQSCPDIQLLPQLVDLFGVCIDDLFGRKFTENALNTTDETIPNSTFNVLRNLPWENDDTIRGVVYKCHTLLKEFNDISEFVFKYDGEALNVKSFCNIECETINGGAIAAGNINCETLYGNVDAGDVVNCETTEGNVKAGGNANSETIEGNVKAGGNVNSETIGDNVGASDNVNSETIGDNVGASDNEIVRLLAVMLVPVTM